MYLCTEHDFSNSWVHHNEYTKTWLVDINWSMIGKPHVFAPHDGRALFSHRMCSECYYETCRMPASRGLAHIFTPIWIFFCEIGFCDCRRCESRCGQTRLLRESGCVDTQMCIPCAINCVALVPTTSRMKKETHVFVYAPRPSGPKLWMSLTTCSLQLPIVQTEEINGIC